MTVSSTSPLIVYDYTGVGVYTFPFRIFEDTDLVITHDTDDGQGTLLINQVDYLVGIIEEIEVYVFTITTHNLVIYPQSFLSEARVFMIEIGPQGAGKGLNPLITLYFS